MQAVERALALILERIGLSEEKFLRFAMQVIRFLLSGGTAAFVHISLLFLFTEYGGLWYIYSSILAFILAFGVSFSLQKYWVFKSGEHTKIPKQLPLHLSTALINLGLNTLLLFALVEYFHIWYLAAQVMASAIIAIESFLVFRWIFR